MQEEKLRVITQFLLFQADGGKYTETEIEAKLHQNRIDSVAKADGNIGMINVFGMIAQRMDMMMEHSGGVSTDALGVQFRAMIAEPSIKAIVLNLDTPGGAVSGVPELAQEILDSRGAKPIIAQINSLAASAGYWLASAADEIVSTPSGQGGSIGVYTIHEDLTQHFANEGVKHTIIRAGEHKITNNPFEPLNDVSRKDLQDRVNKIRDEFTGFIAQGRKTTQAKVVDGYGDGKVFDSQQMLKRGMIDRISTLPQTLERFGMSVHPVATMNRKNRVEAGGPIDVFRSRITAGVQPSVREFERLLRDVGFTNSEAERAVRLCYRDAKGEPWDKRSAIADQSNLVQIQAQLDSISNLLKLG
jgi:signal peptide peptidase SppA